MNMARIWIVEDDPKIGLLIEMAVKKAGHDAHRMLDAVEMEKYLKKKPLPDLMLLDLMLREKNGYTVLSEWKERQATRNIPVIIISARSAERDKVQGLKLGAEDYITKPFGVRELQARIQTALRRLPTEPERIEKGDLALLPESRGAYADGRRIELTAKEFDLLLCLARHDGETVTRPMLLKEVWDYDDEEDTSRTVDSHIKSLRTKLGDSAGDPKYIQTVRGTGYRLIAGEEK
jgi:two-component system alkaline phosphatase synthesis response regulator PhoP